MRNRIDYWRHREGLTYRCIAEEVGTTAQYISMLAKGKRRNPGIEIMEKIADTLNKKLRQVFLFDSDKY